jgi:hypothetical protein
MKQEKKKRYVSLHKQKKNKILFPKIIISQNKTGWFALVAINHDAKVKHAFG